MPSGMKRKSLYRPTPKQVKKLLFSAIYPFSLSTNNLTYQWVWNEPSSPVANNLHASDHSHASRRFLTNVNFTGRPLPNFPGNFKPHFEAEVMMALKNPLYLNPHFKIFPFRHARLPVTLLHFSPIRFFRPLEFLHPRSTLISPDTWFLSILWLF